VVVDTGTFFNVFGQLIILILIQIGGLGFMTMATFVFLILGKRITLRERLVLQEALNEFGLSGLVKLTRNILLTTFVIEAVGAALLSTRLIPAYGFVKGLYFSFFQSISTFCNAGFDLIGEFRSFTPFANDVVVNFTLMGLIVLGGLGFSVILDVYRKRNFKKLSLHSKTVLVVTGILILIGFCFFLVVESGNPKTIGDPKLTVPGKLMAALFQSITPRTAGINTIDINSLTSASKFMTVILMFIGASPASTGGGIKTTTMSIVLLMVISVIRGREDVDIFGKRIPSHIGGRALAITMVGFGLLVMITMVLSLAEAAQPDKGLFNFINILFEVASAFGTVGLTTGITPYLTPVSKFFLILTMFAGRVGPLTLALALAHRQSKNRAHIKYPEDKIMVG